MIDKAITFLIKISKKYLYKFKEIFIKKSKSTFGFTKCAAEKTADEINKNIHEQASDFIDNTIGDRINEAVNNFKRMLVTKHNMKIERKIRRKINIDLRRVVVKARKLADETGHSIDDIINPNIYDSKRTHKHKKNSRKDQKGAHYNYST